VVAAVVWLLVSRVGDIGADATGFMLPWHSIFGMIILGKFDYWLRQTVGLFGYGLIGLPIWVYVAWGMVQGVLVLAGFALTRSRRLAYTIIAIPLVCFLVGVAADLYMVRRVGFWMQGRYFLPLWIGMFFLAALAIPYRSVPALAVRRLTALGFLVWAMAVGVGLIATQLHFMKGNGKIHYPTGWQPPAGVATPLLVAVAGLIATGWLAYLYSRAPGEDGEATDGGGATRPRRARELRARQGAASQR
jgi:hypothetical protein